MSFQLVVDGMEGEFEWIGTLGVGVTCNDGKSRMGLCHVNVYSKGSSFDC